MTCGTHVKCHGYDSYDGAGHQIDRVCDMNPKAFLITQDRVDFVNTHQSSVKMQLLKNDDFLDYERAFDKVPYIPDDKWVNQNGNVVNSVSHTFQSRNSNMCPMPLIS